MNSFESMNNFFNIDDLEKSVDRRLEEGGKEMTRNVHLSQSVRGAIELTFGDPEEALDFFQDDGESYENIHILRNALYDQLAQGHEKMKIGECDNWDWKKGCLGHES